MLHFIQMMCMLDVRRKLRVPGLNSKRKMVDGGDCHSFISVDINTMIDNDNDAKLNLC